jgi:hypothetical protein
MCTTESDSETCTTYVLHNQKLRRKFEAKLLSTPTIKALRTDSDEFKIIHATLKLWTEQSRKYKKVSAAMARVCRNNNYSYILMRSCLSLIDEARSDLTREVRE